ILSAGGYRTGLFTSPHLISFTERIRIGGAEIEEGSVVHLAERVMAAAPEESTFFEIITAMAALHFAEEGVDIAVFEAGMGGRLDATNALNGLLSIITPVSLDHTDYLGSRIGEIAVEKSGICKAGTPVVSARQEPEAARVIARHARELGSSLYLCGENFDARWQQGRLNYRGLSLSLDDLSAGLTGLYQSGNAALALAAAELLSGAGFPVAPQALAAGIERASWPGRMELFPGEPRVILDGAHNPAGACALAEALSQIARDRLFMVAGVMGDKELSGILSPLLPLADAVFAVAPAIERALPAVQLARFCREAGARTEEAGSVEQGIALARAAAGSQDLVVVCGSLFTVGEARSILLSRSFDPFRG
ncbi:MAG TPA: bifunctional folylpolyglutamate synthase/dihydrofolate synthase, partial [Geobacter sp.]|nr:bifunctional folylpolyglutamate synthase/dihydrofolate synthase [Geobacter sp.]